MKSTISILSRPFILICRHNPDLALGLGKVRAVAAASVAERIKWGRPTLAAEMAATVTVLASILRVTVMAAAVVAVAAVAAAAEVVAAVAALRVRMGAPKQAAELDPHKPVDPDPGRA